jgi:hypothetical protein
MNRCADIEKRLSAYLEGDVAPQEQKFIDEHLGTCSQCNMTFEDMKKTAELLRNLKDVEPPPWLKHKIMAQVKEEAKKRTGILQKLFFPLHIKIPVQVFAACLVAVMTLYVFKTTGPEIESLQAPSGQGQTVHRTDKQYKKAVPPSVQLLKMKPAPEKHYGKDKAASAQAPKETTDAVAPREASPTLALPAPAPILVAPSRSVLAKPYRGQEIEGRNEAFQPAPLSAGAPEFALKKKEDTVVSDKDVQYHLGHKSVINELQQKTSAEKKQQTVTMTVNADKTVAAANKIESMLNRLNATDIKQESQENIEIITAVLPAQKLKELYEKLKNIGKVKENILLYNIPEGEIAVRIEIVHISKIP